MKGNDPDFMMNFQKQIKNNSTDLQNLVNDLADWSQETIQQEQTRKTTGGSRAAAGQAAAAAPRKPLPPIRNRIDISNSLQTSERQAAAQAAAKKKAKAAQEKALVDKAKRDTTPMPDYYKAWDKIGRELEEASDDSDTNDTGDQFQAKNPKFVEDTRSTAEMFKPTSGAKPNTSIVVKGARQQ